MPRSCGGVRRKPAIKRVGTVSCAKLAGTLYAVLGLFVGGTVSLVAIVGGLASRSIAFSGVSAAALGVGAIIAFPILYGGVGFLFALLAARLYKILAGFLGGIQIDIE